MTNALSEQRREVFLFSYLWDIVDEGRITLLNGWWRSLA